MCILESQRILSSLKRSMGTAGREQIVPSLLCFRETPICSTVFSSGAPVLKGCVCVRAGPEEGHGNGEKNGAPILKSRSGRGGDVEPGEGSAQRSHWGFSMIKEGL